MDSRKLVRWWVFASAAAMVVGAFGPWVKALGESVRGTDGSNDGWFVVAAAALGALLFYVLRSRRTAAIWPLLAGAVGIAVTLYDRSDLQDRINQGGALFQALVQVGWGLNLALAASVSMAVAALVSLIQGRGVTSPTPAVPASPAE